MPTLSDLPLPTANEYPYNLQGDQTKARALAAAASSGDSGALGKLRELGLDNSGNISNVAQDNGTADDYQKTLTPKDFKDKLAYDQYLESKRRYDEGRSDSNSRYADTRADVQYNRATDEERYTAAEKKDADRYTDKRGDLQFDRTKDETRYKDAQTKDAERYKDTRGDVEYKKKTDETRYTDAQTKDARRYADAQTKDARRYADQRGDVAYNRTTDEERYTDKITAASAAQALAADLAKRDQALQEEKHNKDLGLSERAMKLKEQQAAASSTSANSWRPGGGNTMSSAGGRGAAASAGRGGGGGRYKTSPEQLARNKMRQTIEEQRGKAVMDRRAEREANEKDARSRDRNPDNPSAGKFANYAEYQRSLEWDKLKENSDKAKALAEERERERKKKQEEKEREAEQKGTADAGSGGPRKMTHKFGNVYAGMTAARGDFA